MLLRVSQPLQEPSPQDCYQPSGRDGGQQDVLPLKEGWGDMDACAEVAHLVRFPCEDEAECGH